jgi:hypothetical protein
MADVLAVPRRPYPERRPVVCLDEVPVPVVGETRTPLPAAPGRPGRSDDEYVRNGPADLFRGSEPRLGWRRGKATARRTAKDLAEVLRELAEDVHEEADRIVLVTDTLNTDGPGCPDEAFDPARARRIAAKRGWHYTPKHRSWLNMAGVGLAAWANQCLDRRIGAPDERTRQGAAWEAERNERPVGVKWQFTTAEARVELHRLYPSRQLWLPTRAYCRWSAFAAG